MVVKSPLFAARYPGGWELYILLRVVVLTGGALIRPKGSLYPS